MFGADAFENIEPIDLGHLDVEENQIWRQALYGFNCFKAIAALIDDLDLRIFLEEQAKIAPSQRLVVNDYRFDLVGHKKSLSADFADYADSSSINWVAVLEDIDAMFVF